MALNRRSAAINFASALASDEPPRRSTRMGRAFETGEVIVASNGTRGRWLSIAGISENGRAGLSPMANALIDRAVLVVGGERHLSLIGAVRGETLVWRKPFRDT